LLTTLGGSRAVRRAVRFAAVGPPSNLDLVRSAIEAYNRRDVGALCELMTPDVTLRPPVFALTGRAYLGHAGIEEWLRDVDESFSSAQIHPLELRDLGDRVLALTAFEVEGQGSRLPFGSELGLVCEIQGGRLATWHGFFNHAEAIAAAGQ
jgi:ketosteroid isomerase-like protein